MTNNTFKSMFCMIVFVLIMLSTKAHAETKTITLGYCGNEITSNDERISLNLPALYSSNPLYGIANGSL